MVKRVDQTFALEAADFTHLADLDMREVFWVTRAKDNLQSRVVRRLQHGRAGNILRDDLIQLTGPARNAYPVELRRVVTLVEVDGGLREMIFPHQQFYVERADHRRPLPLRSLLERYGTAGGGGHFLGTPAQAYLPGLT